MIEICAEDTEWTIDVMMGGMVPNRNGHPAVERSVFLKCLYSNIILIYYTSYKATLLEGRRKLATVSMRRTQNTMTMCIYHSQSSFGKSIVSKVYI